MSYLIKLIEKRTLFVVLIFCTATFLQAQLPFIPYDSIELKVDGTSLENPWAGGFNSPQFSNIDLDGDGVQDLVAFERGFFGTFKTFLQKGNAGESGFIHDQLFQHLFPHLQNWALLVDYNCDGYEDIFTAVPGGIKVYRNDYKIAGYHNFKLVTSLLHSDGMDGNAPLFVSPPDLPAITDVDGDGDLDILTFEQLGNAVEYHKNLSMEKYGHCDSLVYELRNACWGYFSENPINNSISLFDTCDNNVENPEKSGRHAGSTLLGFDINGDDVKDLLLGDISYTNLTLLSNGGTTTNASIIASDASFPSNTVPVDFKVFPAAYYIDANNDGTSDLLVTPNNPNTSENFDNVWFYENTREQNNPEFIFKQNNFLQESMIDLGAGTFAVFFDENADGLMDIIAGNFGYFEDAGQYRSQLALFRNTGNPTAPSFELTNKDYGNFSALGFNGMYPAFGDMDGDGDGDMLVGDENGMLHYFINEGGQGNPANFALNQPNFKNIDVGQAAKPQIVDVNRDGLADILAGNRSGTLDYFENIGTETNPDFSSSPTIENFGNVDVMAECCTGFSAPFLTMDSLDKFILYVGSEQGFLYLYNNIENNLEGSFSIVDSLYLNATYVNVDGANINGNESMELVFGQYTGGLALLKKGTRQWIGIKESEVNPLRFKIYPNPASKQVYFKFDELSNIARIELTIYNSMGMVIRKITEVPASEGISINCSAIPSGIYYVTIRDGFHLGSGKLIIH